MFHSQGQVLMLFISFHFVLGLSLFKNRFFYGQFHKMFFYVCVWDENTKEEVLRNSSGRGRIKRLKKID